ncbi:MAG: divergent PAP2 family protein [Clostridia bacterium]|nr:divergent PAP2 family protein [Clostridia bacterium]
MVLLISDNIYKSLITFVILALFFTWASTQTFKVLLKLYLGEKFHLNMLFADGDFPSTHTAVVISSLCIVVFLTFYGKNQAMEIWKALSDIKSVLIMATLAGIAMRDAVGQRHRQDNTNQNLKNLKDLIANSSSIDSNSIEILEKKTIVTDVITETFEAIDNEALKRVGHLKHELVGGILSGFLGASYTICIFFGYFKTIPWLVLISLLYFFGMGTFLKMKPIIEKLYKNFK